MLHASNRVIEMEDVTKTYDKLLFEKSEYVG